MHWNGERPEPDNTGWAILFFWLFLAVMVLLVAECAGWWSRRVEVSDEADSQSMATHSRILSAVPQELPDVAQGSEEPESRTVPSAPVQAVSEGRTDYIYALDQPAAIVSLPLSDNWLIRTVPVMLCESRGDPKAQRTTVVEGVSYRVVGLMQLLLDRPMRALIAELGYTEEEMLEPGPNLHVAWSWSQRTDRGIPFRKWSCKP